MFYAYSSLTTTLYNISTQRYLWKDINISAHNLYGNAKMPAIYF